MRRTLTLALTALAVAGGIAPLAAAQVTLPRVRGVQVGSPPQAVPPSQGTPAAAPGGAAGPLPAGDAPGGGSFSTISGRPPEPPARRVEPRIWEISFESNIASPITPDRTTPALTVPQVNFWMPLVLQSTYSVIDPSSVRTEVSIDGRLKPLPPEAIQFRQGLSQGMSAVGFGLRNVSAQGLKWLVRWRVQCWSSVVDEAAAAAATWPTEWPEDARGSLQAEPGIEAGHPDMKAFVDRVSKGNLRSVTPWIAAKELVRATITSYRGVDATGTRIENGFTRGVVFNGALSSLRAGTGSSHDLVAACVAVLRTADIPARIVLGAAEVLNSSGTSTPTRLVSWGELWLPGAGWVPFDPNELRSSIRGGLSLERPWKRFGTWDGLNECIPLCYGWSLAMPGFHSLPYPAGFVWSLAPGQVDLTMMKDRVIMQILSRGRGRESR